GLDDGPIAGLLVHALFVAVAKARKKSMERVAMAWVLKKPVVNSPIVGVSKMNHLEDAIAAVDFELNGDDVKALEAPYKSLHVA
ncbi:aldo/keto reductase, partial [Rhizobium johnstonii]|uniref:aldo/keto reductase n=1 Tax=Rhizobium johnstonii TaxID=3019933 RepID=UPI003F9B574D